MRQTPPAPPTAGLRLALPYARPEAGRLALAAGAAAAEVACSLLRPWPLALAVDSALGGRRPAGAAGFLGGWGPVPLLLAAGAATVLLSVAEGLLDGLGTGTSERAAERIGARLRAAVLGHVLTLSLRWHDRTRSGEVVSRLTTDVGRVLDALVATCTTLLPDLLLLGGALLVLLSIDPALAALGLAVVPVLAWLTAGQRHRVRTAERAAREASGRLAATATELLRNVRAVQAFARHDRAGQLFGAANDGSLRAEQHAVTTEARWAPVPGIVLAVGTGAVLVAGGLRVRSGLLTTGELLVVLSYLRDLQSPVRGLVRLTAVRAKAAASLHRLAEVLGCTEAIPLPTTARPLPPAHAGLRLEGVTFAYRPGRPVLDGFALDVAAGETVCLYGPSGAGKSTVLHLLLRLYDADAGRVLVDGVDVRDLDPVELRRRLAFVPQDPWLLDGTLAENIAFGAPGATRGQVLAAGRAAWVDEFARALPQGYDTPLGEGGVALSGGQRRRVAIARAVISPAPVVLLDEPTTSLDAESARRVIDAIGSLGGERTLLLVTHDPQLAAIADRVVPVRPIAVQPAPRTRPLPVPPTAPPTVALAAPAAPISAGDRAPVPAPLFGRR
jgi:ATP-binding cassette, subfamily B, bacterial